MSDTADTPDCPDTLVLWQAAMVDPRGWVDTIGPILAGGLVAIATAPLGDPAAAAQQSLKKALASAAAILEKR